MNPLAPGRWMKQLEDRLPNPGDPRVAVVFWAVAAQIPVLGVCTLIVLVAGPPFSLCITGGLLGVACTATALIARGRIRAGAGLAIGCNVALYLAMSPAYGGGIYSPMMTSVSVMVVLAALALGWQEALGAHIVSQAAILIEIAMLAGLASKRMHLALVRTTDSERALQEELVLRREAEAKLSDALAVAKSASEAKSSFLANMSHHQPEVRRHGARARPRRPSRADDGRGDRGPERARRGQHLPVHPADPVACRTDGRAVCPPDRGGPDQRPPDGVVCGRRGRRARGPRPDAARRGNAPDPGRRSQEGPRVRPDRGPGGDHPRRPDA